MPQQEQLGTRVDAVVVTFVVVIVVVVVAYVASSVAADDDDVVVVVVAAAHATDVVVGAAFAFPDSFVASSFVAATNFGATVDVVATAAFAFASSYVDAADDYVVATFLCLCMYAYEDLAYFYVCICPMSLGFLLP